MARLSRGLPGSPSGDLPWIAAVAAVAVAVVLVFGLVPKLTSARPPDRAVAAGGPGFAGGDVVPADSATVVPRTTGRPLRVAFVGDSLTVGQDATVSAHTFRRLVVDSWGGEDQVRADAFAQPGLTTSEVNRLVPAGHQTDVAIVETGTNDYWKRAAPQQLNVDYGALLDKIRAASPNAVLLCLGLWQRPVETDPYDAEVQQQCLQHGGRFLPLSGIYDSDGVHGPAGVPLEDGVTSDDYHPNDVGHQKIANLIRSSLVLV